jgi:hypothetical protein
LLSLHNVLYADSGKMIDFFIVSDLAAKVRLCIS